MEMFGVACDCGHHFYLVDTKEGPCPKCEKTVKYINRHTETKPTKKQKRLDVDAEGAPLAVKFK